VHPKEKMENLGWSMLNESESAIHETVKPDYTLPRQTCECADFSVVPKFANGCLMAVRSDISDCSTAPITSHSF